MAGWPFFNKDTMNTTSIASRLKTMITAGPTVTVTIGGSDYTGTKMPINRDRKYMDQGVESGYEFSVLFAAADFSSVPTPDTIATVDSTDYRIITTELDSAGAGLRVDLAKRYS